VPAGMHFLDHGVPGRRGVDGPLPPVDARDEEGRSRVVGI